MNYRIVPDSLPSLLRSALLVAATVVITAGTAEAQRPVPATSRVPVTQQRQQQSREQVVPAAFLPPAGMCRIWINDVPPGQQPAPTDCASAVRNRPANARVLFGDDRPKSQKGKSDKKKSSPSDELVDLITRRISQ